MRCPRSRAPRRLLTLPLLLALAAAVALAPATPAPAQEPYLVGRGSADITGEAAEVGMFGYGTVPPQQASGIHLRQRARAFVVADPASGRRVAIVIADLGALFQAVHQGVIARLRQRYGGLYTERNVLLAATHTHAGPGGHSHYLLYQVTALGFQERTYNAIVDGIVEAVARAHADLKPGSLAVGRATLTNASANRSLRAFERNPAADRAAFPQGIDPTMTVLSVRQGGTQVGAVSWFPTHATSLTSSNTLISGDNKGYAAYAWEHDLAGARYRDAQPDFVAAFAQGPAGDMSPNLNLRPGSGPTEDEVANTRIIGERQLDAALRALAGTTTPLAGGIDYRMRYVDMSRVTVSARYTGDGREHQTCPAALGTAFAAGAEDGPTADWIREGESNPLLAAVGGLAFDIPPSLRACHAPKEVLLPVQTQDLTPYPWTPEVLPLQILKLGQLYLVAVPAEFTIVSGLRARRTVAAELGTSPDQVVLAGYANAYAGYVTTPEEYDQQDYEGGATHFGRFTLPAYQQELARLAASLRDGTTLPDLATPRDLTGEQLSFQTGVVMDGTPLGRRFGDVLTDARAAYRPGETVTVEFYTGHPKNNLRRGGTFLEVQRREASGWVAVADDGDWATTYRWTRLGGSLSPVSKATITWSIPAGTPPGTYRIVHYGDWKNLLGKVTPFTGTSREFTVG